MGRRGHHAKEPLPEPRPETWGAVPHAPPDLSSGTGEVKRMVTGGLLGALLPLTRSDIQMGHRHKVPGGATPAELDIFYHRGARHSDQ
jgi:hypothetical protein